ncbi:MAG: PQQ-dependent sugar dehydrogenase [Polyangiaceae bacterium]|nr:PQQ-dependent sugar dehydrogenase [Polyangiaceae bacterium]MCW5791894.1 PQQ-dependent sugar dehydrogenase [Polyangiaceae bacterium]
MRLMICGALLVSVGVMTACGDDDSRPAPSGAGGSAASGGSAGSGASGGTAGSGGASGSGGTSGSAGTAGTGGGVSCGRPAPPALRLEEVMTGLSSPMGLVGHPTHSHVWYVIERRGRVYVTTSSTSVLILNIDVSTQGEGGLLGFALHPQFDQGDEKRFYVSYTESRGGGELRSVVSEYQLLGDDDEVERSERRLLEIDQPATNHNGGGLAFGPDGYLYVAFGDGGGGNDTFGHGQDPSTPLGAILRLDVDNHPTAPPGNHPDHPYVYHYGVRNPYRISFDRLTGDFYFGDVGQDAWEEVNAVTHASGRHNFGWSIMEGNHCRGGGNGCDRAGLTLPIAEYSHEGQSALSVTGGVVYRGSTIPALVGRYLYADFYLDQLESLVWTRTGTETCDAATLEVTGADLRGVVAFGEDADGEVYVVGMMSGNIARLVP